MQSLGSWSSHGFDLDNHEGIHVPRITERTCQDESPQSSARAQTQPNNDTADQHHADEQHEASGSLGSGTRAQARNVDECHIVSRPGGCHDQEEEQKLCCQAPTEIRFRDPENPWGSFEPVNVQRLSTATILSEY